MKHMDKENLQRILETTTMAVLTQGGASVNDSNQCQYRGEGGRKCAVGHLIDDKFYLSSEMEGQNIFNDSVYSAVLMSLHEKYQLPNSLDSSSDNNEFKGFLSILQSAHDFALHESGVNIYTDRIRQAAKKYSLTSDFLINGMI